MEVVRRDEVRPQPPAPPGEGVDPYRVLFPIGAVAAIAALVPWTLLPFAAQPWWPRALHPGWPGLSHPSLMVQGFEAAFVAGFLLTAMPAFTHGARASRNEVVAAALAAGAFVVLRVVGVPGAAFAFLATLLVPAIAVLRRVRPGAAAPPEEFLLVATGMALGIAGGIVQALSEVGALPSQSARMGMRCVSLGLLPALVLGLGGLLVPTFSRVPDPLAIVGVARAGDRPRRRAFALLIALLLVVALNLEFAGLGTLGGLLRAVAVLASTLLAWKIHRAPAEPDRLSRALRAAGVALATGFTVAAIAPAWRVEAWHVAFVGGYALLTLSIGTRVVVSHGGHARTEERVVLSRRVLTGLGLAVLVRAVGPLADPSRAVTFHALAAALAIVAIGLWLRSVWPRVRRTRRPVVMPGSARD
jgi:uncharacterized protein involved in response to NO